MRMPIRKTTMSPSTSAQTRSVMMLVIGIIAFRCEWGMLALSTYLKCGQCQHESETTSRFAPHGRREPAFRLSSRGSPARAGGGGPCPSDGRTELGLLVTGGGPPRGGEPQCPLSPFSGEARSARRPGGGWLRGAAGAIGVRGGGGGGTRGGVGGDRGGLYPFRHREPGPLPADFRLRPPCPWHGDACRGGGGRRRGEGGVGRCRRTRRACKAVRGVCGNSGRAGAPCPHGLVVGPWVDDAADRWSG